MEEEKLEIRPTLPIMTDIRDMIGQGGGDVPPALQAVATKPTNSSSTSIASLPPSSSSAPSSNGRVSNTNNNTNFDSMFEPFTGGGSGNSGGLSFTAF